ncbi:MAG TPA: hypothetical protein PK496_06500 [Bacteroidales bacterium]|nr:hypothetical protein [Bacteroidales bacterium]
MKKVKIVLIISVFVVYSFLSNASAQTGIDIETGLVFTGYNDVRIPGNTGTFFSLSDDLSAKEKIFYRIRINHSFGNRHDISVLYAPLTIVSSGIFTDNVIFEGVLFQSGRDVEADYKFNSYRLTYRYDIIKRDKLEFGIGFTAKIRDAKIALRSGGIESIKTNVGFVPILNFRLLWNVKDNLGVLLYGDALAAPQGRAEDVLLALQYKVNEKVTLKGGYRILEGGADNDEVYSFALFNYAVLGVTFKL